MALDDVVIRAMSKPPGDRYPSAGDLGRAALAALRGEQPSVPERTVATGAAATKESPSPSPAGESTAETRRIDPELRARQASGGSGRRRRAVLAGGLTAAAAIVVAAIALGGGGEGSAPKSPSGTGGSGTNAPAGSSDARGKTELQPLSKSELIEKTDAICADSQETYKGVFSQSSEESPDAAYSQVLVGISSRAVGRLRALRPPPALEADYHAYVRAQERVKSYDRQALKAAEAGDEAAYLAARRRRDDEAGERYELARTLGLETCSPNRE